MFAVTNPSDNRILTSLASGTNQANAETNLTYDGTTLNVTGTSAGSTLLSVNGVSGTLLAVNDITSGSLLQVVNASNTTVFEVSSFGFSRTFSSLTSGQTTTFDAFSIPDTAGQAGFFEYFVRNTVSSGSRAGNVSAVWDSGINTVEYNETSTADMGGSTIALSFSTLIISGNLTLRANITSGTWNVSVGARIVT